MRLSTAAPYSRAVRERAVRDYWSDPSASIASVARTVGCSEKTVRRWVHQAAAPKGTQAPRGVPATTKGAWDEIIWRLDAIARRLDALEDQISAMRAEPSPELEIRF